MNRPSLSIVRGGVIPAYSIILFLIWMIPCLSHANHPETLQFFSNESDANLQAQSVSLSMSSEAYFFDEDTPERVWGISFDGNETYSSTALRQIIGLEAPSTFRKLRFWNRRGFDFDQTELMRDEIRIKRYYQRRGFPHVQVSSEVRQGRRDWVRRITFFVDEGEAVIIDSLAYVVDAPPEIVEMLLEERDIQRAKERHVMQQVKRYQLIQHSDVEGLFLLAMRNTGFAHAQAFVTAAVDTAGKSAEVVVTLVPGPPGTIGELVVEGHQTVPESLVLRHLGLKTGDPYRSKDLRSAQQQLFGHPLFRFATVSMPPQPPDTVVDLTIRVREHALRSLRLQAGVGLEEIVRASVSWQHRNPFGNAHNFTVSTRASFIEQRVSMNYLIPYVFNPKSRVSISPFGQRLDERGYLLYRAGITNTLIHQLSRITAVTASYEFTRNREELFKPDLDLPDERQLYNISAIQFSGYYNQLEVQRYQGWIIRPFAEFSGFFGSGSLRYNKYNLDIRRYITLGSSTQLAIRNEGGLLTFAAIDELPPSIRLYTGGTQSVRGWQRGRLGPKRAVFDSDGDFSEYIPVGGKTLYNFNLELRQELHRLIPRFGVSVFLDGGALWDDFDSVNLEDLQYGLGVGFQYNTPIGPIRIDVARKLNPTDEDLNRYNGVDYGSWTNHWGLHFSIGQVF